MQKDSRYVIDTIALITHIAHAHYQQATEGEPQAKTIEVDRRMLARLIQLAQSACSGLSPNERSRLDKLVESLAAHYATDGTPATVETLESFRVAQEDIVVPDDAIYSRDEPEKLRGISMWGIYTLNARIMAVRINGPFITVTRNGPMLCIDGYLALDPEGYPYPINRELFERFYVNELDEQIAGRCILTECLPPDGSAKAAEPP